MAADHTTSTSVQDYFGVSAEQPLIDRAAQIVALVQGRESATRTDYAHPRLRDIVELLKQSIQEGSAQQRR